MLDRNSLKILLAIGVVIAVLSSSRKCNRQPQQQFPMYDYFEAAPFNYTAVPATATAAAAAETPTPNPIAIPQSRADFGVASNLMSTPAVDTGNFSEFAPPGVSTQSFLDSSKFFINTIGNSRRNSSHDIRKNIPIPKAVVSPWMNSDIDQDLMRKPLE